MDICRLTLYKGYFSVVVSPSPWSQEERRKKKLSKQWIYLYVYGESDSAIFQETKFTTYDYLFKHL